ncbi:hypothetical protein AUJ10_01880 [Candidatus Pacearchaeota archaeon CG1_02_31_27]|nr:MAG: hypothetical protein AUJ10_01880 [Candidatus Pacearchaeota archaeon CG1_02_31_27]PIN92581.1 MAG: phosphopyruvate hydratase [Candidatus Pacearchaeota archaeon CG10_big_fil_rev_8_21_14_0_10_31_59]PIZ80735.1 MAG: phosphopyruvate hydratase [Candidatus Pacearchaeota archaeon CG_4_10_14_0_2_um_filter_31_10]
MIIKRVEAKKILDSRNEETIKVTVETSKGKFETSAPSGKSIGKNEARPFSKNGIDFSINMAVEIGKRIIYEKINIEKFEDLEKVEKLVRDMDKTENYEIFGGNALFALESSLLKAMAAEHKKELWQFLSKGKKSTVLPLGNCIGGGKHIDSDKKPDFQEFLLLPDTKKCSDAQKINNFVYKKAKKLTKSKDKSWDFRQTDEHAWSPNLSNIEVLDILSKIREKVKNKFKVDLRIGLDIASSSFYEEGKYNYITPQNGKNVLDKDEQVNFILDLIEKYNLYYVEDPIDEEDFESFAKLLNGVKKKNLNCLICGDDLICTKVERLKKAIQKNSVNAIIVKPNQNGSLLETKKVVDLALKNNIIPVISHRSGETLDNTISHLAIAWQIPIIKTGITGKERLAKIKEIIRIEKKK